jgi:hypothetical protein
MHWDVENWRHIYIYADTVIKDGGNIALFIAPRPRTHMF